MPSWTAAFSLVNATGKPLAGVIASKKRIRSDGQLDAPLVQVTDADGYTGFFMGDNEDNGTFTFELSGFVTVADVPASRPEFISGQSRKQITMQPVGIFGGPTPPGRRDFWQSVFNDTDDDLARTWASVQDNIVASNDEAIKSKIRSLLDGPTGDDDEVALINIFRALPCERAQKISREIGVDLILDNVDGSDWDDLMVVFARCGIVNFTQMDDDASRVFVRVRSCEDLNSLPLDAIAQLVRNMFDGACGDEDERAILQIMRCLSDDALRRLVQLPGVGIGEFDYKFDGDNWDLLEVRFRQAGLQLDT